MNKEILNRYCWVLNVLESCQNDEQIETTQKLFDNFIKLHNREILDGHVASFEKVFESEKKAKFRSLRVKKRKTFGFKISKFFLF